MISLTVFSARGDKGGQAEGNEEQEGVRAKGTSNRRSAGTTGGKAVTFSCNECTRDVTVGNSATWD